MRVDIPAKA